MRCFRKLSVKEDDMKKIFVRDIKEQSEIVDFFLIKSINVRVDSRKKEYLDMILSDKTGEISSKKWDLQEQEKSNYGLLKVGDIIKVKANVNIWQGNSQLRITKIRLSNEMDEIDKNDYIKAAPEDSNDMYEFIYSECENLKDSDFRKLTIKLLTDNKDRLLYYPAAARNHHAEYGGLLYHMKRMLESGKKLCEIYKNLNKELVITGVVIHDMEKLNEIDADTNGIASGYSRDGKLLGHIPQGVKEIDKICERIGVPHEKALLLEHMILSHHYEPEFGSPKKPMFPEAELLHYLDVLDARMFDMEEAMEGIEPGTFTERVRVLDNRMLYKPTFK